MDEMFTLAIGRELRVLGHDVVAVKEVDGAAGMDDRQLFEWASQERRVVITENVRDFMPLHVECLRDGSEHAGLIFTSDHRYPRGIGATVGALVRDIDALARATQQLDDDIYWLS